MLGCAWQEAWPHFSEVPAKFMGLHNELAVQNPASICVLKVAGLNQLIDLQVYADGKTTASR